MSRAARRPNLYPIAKKLLDIAVCVALLPFAGIVILACGAAVWLESPGPIFFRQMRTGLHGRRFPMWRIRTMVTNAGKSQRVLMRNLNELTWPDFKIQRMTLASHSSSVPPPLESG